MRLNLPFVTALVALLSTFVAGFGQRFKLARELQLAAEFGLSADVVLKDRQAFHTIMEYGKIPAEYFSLPIDHDDPSVGSFQNRFWANDEYYKPGGPVIVYDAGETNAEASASHLTSEWSFFPKILEEFGAVGVVWEHRYYGKSLPYPVANDTPPEHFKYLTTKQALADIPVFADNFTRPHLQHIDLTPASTPWVLVGGSYAGSRVAFARNMYPDTVFASFAASAPVQARVNMSIYYEQIYRAMVANGIENCAKDTHAALEYIDEQLSQEDTAASIKKLFLGEGAEMNSNEDFTAALLMPYQSFQSSGLSYTMGSLGDFCRWLEWNHETGQSSPDGWAPTLGKKYVAELWAAWPMFSQLVNINMETNCNSTDIPFATCILNAPVTDPDSIAWSWQYCSEWGFYQSNNEGAHSLLSRFQTPEFQQVMCNRQFPEAVERGLLPSQPQADAVNEEFGGWSIRPSNVYWSAGEFDPWRPLTPLSNEEFAPEVTITAEIPQCGVQTAADRVFGYIGNNEEHCFDFSDKSEAGAASRDLFRQALKEWLPCFGK